MKTFLFILFLAIGTVTAAQVTTAVLTDTVQKQPIDSSELYGFTGSMPVKVGKGPGNQVKYLEALRDAQGKPVSFERRGSCCPYFSKNGMMGFALVDMFRVTYFNQNNEITSTILYISFYDYIKPKAPKGFTLDRFRR